MLPKKQNQLKLKKMIKLSSDQKKKALVKLLFKKKMNR